MDSQRFVEEFWQKKPVLLRQFLPGFVDPIDGNDLAGLACEELAESRLIINEGESWQLRHGPFREEHFNELPTQSWTLLVQGVDLWDADVAALKQHFSFLPTWRVEDIMVSYAEEGGGVGPHFDNYDVFLIQGSGQRRWRVGQKCSDNARVDTTSGLRLLQDFEHKDEFILESGDVLYIPPQFAHWGESLGESLCYSVGFRSPSMSEMLRGFSDSLADASDESHRFVDPVAEVQKHPGELTTASLRETQDRLIDLASDPVDFARWFGCNATEAKYPEFFAEATPQLTYEDLDAALGRFDVLIKNVAARYAYSLHGNSVLLFLDGKCATIPSQLLGFAQLLCAADRNIHCTELIRSLPEGTETAIGLEILLDLYNAGSVSFAE